MRKLWVMVCVLMLSLSLAACGSKDENARNDDDFGTTFSTTKKDAENSSLTSKDVKSENNGSSSSNTSGNAELDVSTILADPSAFNKANLSKEQIDEIEKDAKENGYTYSWDEKGYLVIKEADGNTVAWGSKWEKNQFTEQVPALSEDFIVASAVSNNGYTAMLSWTLEDARKYGEKIKNAGYTQNVTSLDSETMYMYLGGNDSYTVVVSWGEGEGTNGALSISAK